MILPKPLIYKIKKRLLNEWHLINRKKNKLKEIFLVTLYEFKIYHSTITW